MSAVWEQEPGLLESPWDWNGPGPGVHIDIGAQAPQWESSLSALGCLGLGRVGGACETVLPALFNVPCLISALHPGAGHSPGILSYYKGIFLFG